MKKVIIAGSRTLLPSVGFIERSLRMVGLTDNQYRIISGNAYGVDQVGEALAKESGWPFEIFPADWETHGNPPVLLEIKKWLIMQIFYF